MTISPYDDAHFLREGVVDINAAVVGVSKARWTFLEESDATSGRAEAIMRKQRFDVLPIANGVEVKKYFRTHTRNDYSNISQETITGCDPISHTHPGRHQRLRTGVPQFLFSAQRPPHSRSDIRR